MTSKKMSRAEMSKAIREKLQDRDESIAANSEGLTVERYMDRWLEAIRGNVRPGTFKPAPDENDARALEALRGFGGNGARAQQWRNSIRLGLNGSKFGNSRDRLVASGEVVEQDGTYYASSSDT